ncbi:LytTR family DNA-binding domain-containing protein [Chitinophaga pollutisoli]|uniref:LytTR family DNA-binding domain-containing protein n=1 Tax=Chitinophaga pollutisoli TaxID=3133966 RepID=A0ABZ2YMK4_9BACT
MMHPPFFIWDDGKFVKINLADIAVLKTEDNYLRLYAKEESYLIRATLDKTLSQLPEGSFVRIHKSFAVALQHLEAVEKEAAIVYGVAFPVSKRYYPELISSLNVLG